MLKNILRLLAASASFVALLLITNPAIALNPTANPDQQFSLHSTLYAEQSPVLSLNAISPVLQFVTEQDTLANHYGCTCATCIQSQEQNNPTI